MKQANNIHDLATKPIGRLLIEYSAPSVIGMLVTSLYNVVDRIYIGMGVGPEAISGLAITFPVMNLSAALGVLIGAGAATRTSIMLGAGEPRKAEQVLGNALVLSLTIGLIYATCFGIWIDDLLRAFGASDVTLPYAHDYMVTIVPFMPVINLCFSFNNVMRSSGYPRRAMVTMILGAVLNIILTPIFIFTLDMGIKGAAIATDISMAVSAAFVMWHFFQRESTVRFKRGIFKLDWAIVWSIVSIGAAPSFINSAACLINVTVNTSLVAYGSDLDVGAAGIFITYASLLSTAVLGIGIGMQPIVGYNYGAGQLHRLSRAFSLAAWISTAICTAGCAFGMLCPEMIAGIFTTDERLIGITANGLRHAMAMFWMVGFQIISTGFFQSIGKAGKSIILSLARQIIFLYPMLIIFPKHIGINGVWVAFPASDALATILTAAFIVWQFAHIKKLSHRINPQTK